MASQARKKKKIFSSSAATNFLTTLTFSHHIIYNIKMTLELSYRIHMHTASLTWVVLSLKKVWHCSRCKIPKNYLPVESANHF